VQAALDLEPLAEEAGVQRGGAGQRLHVADEIVSGLDVSVQAQILSVLAELRTQADFALLLISHDLAVVRYICDRVLVICKVEIVEQGPVEQVFGHPAHDYTKALLRSAGGSGAKASSMLSSV
jgi:peptide/nickel transport system ATP-binding protein